MLAEHGIDPEVAAEFSRRADVVIFTPASPKGVPLCADPVDPRLDRAAAGRTAAGADANRRHGHLTLGVRRRLGRRRGAGGRAGRSALRDDRVRAGASLAALGDALLAHEGDGFASLARYLDPKKIRTACQRLARLDVGRAPSSVPRGRAHRRGRAPRARRGVSRAGKIRISVVYLNTLRQPGRQGLRRRRAGGPLVLVDAGASEPRAAGAVLHRRGQPLHPSGTKARVQRRAAAVVQAGAQVRCVLPDGHAKPRRRGLSRHGAVRDLGARPADDAARHQEDRAQREVSRAGARGRAALGAARAQARAVLALVAGPLSERGAPGRALADVRAPDLRRRPHRARGGRAVARALCAPHRAW